MGVFQSISDFFFGAPNVEFRLQVIGFENAGKTTILTKMKLLEDGAEVKKLVPTVPTIGMDLQEINVKNVSIKVWDLSGQQKMRSSWKYYYDNVNGIVFVIDAASGSEALAEARETLHLVL